MALVVMVVTIDFGWYLTAYQRGGVDFWHKQIIYENIDRYFGAAVFHTHKNAFSQASGS